jgi:hypothetical protein
MTKTTRTSSFHAVLSLDALAIVRGGADDPKTVKPLPITPESGPAFPGFGIMGSAPPSAYPNYPDFVPRPGAKK